MSKNANGGLLPAALASAAIILVIVFQATPAPAQEFHSIAVPVSVTAIIHHPSHPAAFARHYTIHPGDTLSGIAARFLGSAGQWRALWRANPWIPNPNLIRVGWVILIAAVAGPAPPGRLDCDRDRDFHSNDSRECAPGPVTTVSHSGGFSGTLSYSGLEALWRAAGGAGWAANVAACIAEHESGGWQFATGLAGERGYWQINPVNGSLSTYDPFGNARAAIILSHDGTNWSPWTTAPMCGV